MNPVLIGLDWGTTNVRAALLAKDGTVLEERQDRSGVGEFSEQQYLSHFNKLTAEWPDVPALAAGMVGSRQGWVEADYLPCPSRPADLAAGLTNVPLTERTLAIVPGIKMAGPTRFDVMRGEETQIAGLLAERSDQSGTVIMPGSHSKWVELCDGGIESFGTYLSGELFSALSQHTILRHSLGGEINLQAFDAKCAELASGTKSIEGQLFALRARDLLAGADREALLSELSALVIMGELRAGQRDGYGLANNVNVIGTGSLVDLYRRALNALDLEAQILDGTALVWPALLDIASKTSWLEEPA